MARRIIGLTGGIGSGKSTVADELGVLGAEVIDVDAVGRAVAEVGGRAHEKVVAAFGPSVVSDGRLDRAALAAIVFADPDQLRRLESISHPAINSELADRVDELPDDAVVVLDMAILVGSILGRWGDDLSEGYDTVVTVEAPMELRRERLVGRGMDLADAERRIASQPSDEDRWEAADHVVVNNGTTEELRERVAVLWEDLEVDE